MADKKSKTENMYERAISTSHVTINEPLTDCTLNINIEVPWQMCYRCYRMFRAYLVDDELWQSLPKDKQDKFICSKCLRRMIIAQRM